jgi:hypothetical protein
LASVLLLKSNAPEGKPGIGWRCGRIDLGFGGRNSGKVLLVGELPKVLVKPRVGKKKSPVHP